jgi:putative tryptophan/tyrosine transport system substrate-binding protein
MRLDRLKRREFITLLGGATALWSVVSRAQQPAKFYRVAYLALLGDEDAMVVKQRLGELGYTEARNLIFDFRSAEGQPDRLPQLAVDFVKTKADVLIAGFGTLTAKAAQAATTTIPIVFTAVGDPIAAGIVNSLNRPGANITGLHPAGVEISRKRLQVLDDLVPGIQIVAVLLNPDTPFSALALEAVRSAAEPRGQQLEVCEVRTADQLSTSIEAAAGVGATGLLVFEDPLLLSLRRQIVDVAAKLRLFAVYGNRQFVEAGGLLSYGTDRRQLYRRAAEFVDKILKGEKPADIPVERPTKFELVINLKTARALSMDIPTTLLALADEVIE